MTAPTLDVQLHADDLADRLAALVERDGPRVSGAVQSRVDLLLPDLVRLWVRHFGGTDRGPRTVEQAAAYAERAQTRVRAALNPAVVRQGVVDEVWLSAYRMGADHALDTVGRSFVELPDRDRADALDLGAILVDVAAQAVAASSPERVLEQGFGSLALTQARSRRAVTRIDATVAAATTRAAAEGVLDVARDTGASVVWVAERDGCLHCLAYAGEVTTPGVPFPPGLTFADRPLPAHGVLVGPGLHPHCRCTLDVLNAGDERVAEVLKREARRSVLRGWANPTESGPAKVRAADRLLATAAGRDLPKSVQAAARRAVRAGTFGDEEAPDRPRRRPADELLPDRDEAPTDDVGHVLTPAEMDDATLDAAAQAAIADGTDEALIAELLDEMDRRDQRGTADDVEWAKAWGMEWSDWVAATGADADGTEARRHAVMAELLSRGVDEAEAFGQAYGVTSDRDARREVIRRLRAAGFEGAGFDVLARQAYRDYLMDAHNRAVDDTNGFMLNRAGHAAAVSPFELFSGPLQRARKYASDELLEWWEVNGRVTFEEFKAQLLGRDGRAAGSGRFLR